MSRRTPSRIFLSSGQGSRRRERGFIMRRSVRGEYDGGRQGELLQGERSPREQFWRGPPSSVSLGINGILVFSVR